jgi:hypothetical protein
MLLFSRNKKYERGRKKGPGESKRVFARFIKKEPKKGANLF